MGWRGFGGRPQGPIRITWAYSAKDIALYILLLAALVLGGTFLLILGLGGIVRQWRAWTAAGWPAGAIIQAALLAALLAAGLVAVGLVLSEYGVRGRLVGVADGAAGGRREQQAQPEEREPIIVDGNRLLPKLDEALARLRQLEEAPKQPQVSIWQIMIALLWGQPAPGAAQQQPQVPVIEVPPARQIQPGVVLPMLPPGRAGLSRRQWRDVICDVVLHKCTTFRYLDTRFGYKRIQATAVRQALVDAGLAAFSGQQTAPLILAQNIEEKARLELERLGGRAQVGAERQEQHA